MRTSNLAKARKLEVYKKNGCAYLQQLGIGPSLNYCRCGFNGFFAKDNK
jgi:hypothetical protein